MYFKNVLILNIILLTSNSNYSISSNEVKSSDNNLSMGNLDILPNDIKKEILDKIFKDPDLGNKSLEELIKIKNLTSTSKATYDFIKKNYINEFNNLNYMINNYPIIFLTKLKNIGLKDSENISTKMDKAYKILGLPNNANQIEIKNAYKKLALKWHPDKNKNFESTEIFQIIKKAYEILTKK